MEAEADYLQFLQKYYADSVRAADQKALVILTFAVGVFFFLVVRDVPLGPLSAFVNTLFAGKVPEFQAQPIVSAALWIIGIIASLSAQIASLFALAPRSRSSSEDRIFWKNVARLEFTSFSVETKEAIASGDHSGLYSNVYSLAHILSAKYNSASLATQLGLTTLYCVTGFVVLRWLSAASGH